MTTRLAIIIALSVFFGCLFLGAVVTVVREIVSTRKKQRVTGVKQGSWWQRHKPTKRRLIQLYAALLVNANIKGFFTGSIYKGGTKYLCVPGLNCYSCPGAVGACPLGALQNALAQSGTAAPYYVLGILILFGLLLGRTICGFLCPVGLGQELLYKIKTPKLKKSRYTRILSYLKYVILAVFVVALPLIYGLMGENGGQLPAFCKYLCPAGTLGGAIGLLINPANADYFASLGALFTWKFCVLVAICVACVFVFRAFCRFLCPLGALYGFFNKIALLGIKLDKNKCTDCGLCISHCKMDVKRVGDHECINCGECMDVCPAKAISWKGGKLFLHKNAVETAPAAEPVDLRGNVTSSAFSAPVKTASPIETPAPVETPAVEETVAPVAETVAPAARRKRSRGFWLQVTAWAAALAVLCGALVYYNFIYREETVAVEPSATDHILAVSKNGGAGEVFFTVSAEEGELSEVSPRAGAGTAEEPYLLETLEGSYRVSLAEGETKYYLYGEETKKEYVLRSTDETLVCSLSWRTWDGGTRTVFEAAGVTETKFTPYHFGNGVGEIAPDFTLKQYSSDEEYTLSEMRGKIAVVNFWTTWCTPCVGEIPYFERLANSYPSDVAVALVHGTGVTEDVAAFISEKGWAGYTAPFLQDTVEQNAFLRFGGRSSFPMTVILDRDGVIAFTLQNSVTYDLLEEQVRSLLG